MKLNEYLKENPNDYDTYDTVYDAIITICYIDEIKDDYDKFCIGITEKVNIESVLKNDRGLMVNWSEMIENNMELFKEFTNKYWKYNYEDDEEEFIYQWLVEIQNYITGLVPESFYKILCDFIEKIN